MFFYSLTLIFVTAAIFFTVIGKFFDSTKIVIQFINDLMTLRPWRL